MGQTLGKRIGILWVVGVAMVATAGTAAAQRPGLPTYSVTDLGTLGGSSSEASGINTLGDVVGSSTTADGVTHAFLYRNGRLIDLGTLPGGSASYARAINDRGDVVGYGGINNYGPQFQEFVQGFVWQNGEMRSVGQLFCPCSFNRRYGTSKAFAVSESGLIVGDSQTSGGESPRHAFVWQNSMNDLTPQLDRTASSFAYGINDLHQITGEIDGRAFLATDGTSQDLGVLPGYASSTGRSVNDKGQVAGDSARSDGTTRAVLWDLGTVRDLGTLSGDAASEAYAINVNGQVVGRSGAKDFPASRAVIWQDGAAVDLNRLITATGWTLTNATGINDVRQIVGVGTFNGQVRAFLLTPQ